MLSKKLVMGLCYLYMKTDVLHHLPVLKSGDNILFACEVNESAEKTAFRACDVSDC